MHSDGGRFGGRFGIAYLGTHAKSMPKVHAKTHAKFLMTLGPCQTQREFHANQMGPNTQYKMHILTKFYFLLKHEN